jgi:outer membrane lipoprotein carrier protein
MMKSTLLFLLAAGTIFAQSDSLWQRLRTRYLGLRTLSGTFEERICSEEAGTCQTFEGKFYIRVPGRYRLVVTDPVDQVIVSDSSTLWIHLPQEKRAVQQPAGGFAPVLAFLGPVLDSTATATVKRDSAGVWRAYVDMDEELSMLGDLVLELDPTATRIRGFEFTDAWKQHYQFKLTDQQWNPALDAKLFRFTPPKGTTVER